MDHSHGRLGGLRPDRLRVRGGGDLGLQGRPNYAGAELFATHCSGCHTLQAAGTQGTGNRGERTQGPNLNQRTETVATSLYAIRNGGYSGAIMPQNIVVGDEAKKVARFVAKYAGQDAAESPTPGRAEALMGAAGHSRRASPRSPARERPCWT